MKNFNPSFITGVLFISLSIIIFLSLVSYNPQDSAFLTFPPSKTIHNLIGKIGLYVSFSLIFIFGYASYFIPFYIFLKGLNNLGLIKFYGIAKGRIVKFLSFVFIAIFICALIGIFFKKPENIYLASGVIGYFLSIFFQKYLGFWGSFITLTVIILILLWLVSGYFFIKLFLHFRHIVDNLLLIIKNILQREKIKKKIIENKEIVNISKPLKEKVRDTKLDELESSIDVVPEIKVYTPKITSASNIAITKGEGTLLKKDTQKQPREDDLEEISISKEEKPVSDKVFDEKSYILPSLDCLKVPPLLDTRQIKDDIEANIKTLEETLSDFGVGAKVVSVQKGPVVTLYELQPFAGVKIQRITTLSDDIALAMKSASIRIVAPIPGRGTIGIEIPNTKKHLVYLREVIEEKVFSNTNSKLALALGKDVSGNPVVADLKEMPHLLIAGTTGSGKTVCVNSIISSIIFKAKPNEVKFILIDPKKVELAPFSGIPHLLHPIISEPKKAFSALNWAVEEMENRYKVLADEGARNIDIYNKNKFKLPYIVIIVDELADLMVVAKDKIETSIQRLAQLSRAVGIHLILATQRPSVDVITGVIKANFPARISFKVSSKVDSRTVLDMIGAEKLLGKGDMLFIRPGLIKPVRAQASFIDDEDIENLTNFIKQQGSPIYEEGIIQSQKSSETSLEEDELLDEAIKIILLTRQASASLLQRRLRVGYTRAARLLDLMEIQGIIGPFSGSKPREILVDPDSYLKEKKLI
ncbi:MAG: DNA translocase FtsK [Candidatus Omnitrophica bacterium]|nr:DNA translocase FtsK [Candidatus Omnitrophota bacterium]MCM8826118.1 DNA translocase FtsK [Candidatus Omnitrophota bacterium]